MSDTEVWNVLTLKGGQVSLLKNLSAEECRAVVQRIQGGDPWSQQAIYDRLLASHAKQHLGGPRLGGVYGGGGWSVDRCEWWGSMGGELEVWPKPADYDARLAAAAGVAAAIRSTSAAMAKAAA